MPSSQDPPGRGSTSARRLPLLPLRDIIVFPGRVVRLFVGREKSIQALEEAMNADKDIALAAQIKSKTNTPTRDDIYSVGTVGRIVQLLRLPDGTVRVLVEGRCRLKVLNYLDNERYFEVEIQEYSDSDIQRASADNSADNQAASALADERSGTNDAKKSARSSADKTREDDIAQLCHAVLEEFRHYVQANKRVPPEILNHAARVDAPGALADLIASHLSLKLGDKQQLLEAVAPRDRLALLHERLRAERRGRQNDQEIRSRVKKQMERPQRERFDRSRDSANKKSWGARRHPGEEELEELAEKIAEMELPDEVRERLDKELGRLKMMGPMSAEATVVRNYIDWVIALPWGAMTEDRLDIAEAEAILDAEHFGLEKPKERILEHLAVQALVAEPRGPILCFVGPPGVGKTSLGRSIARATGRNFVRLSLGGVRDEAEIRGHRRTYIGAMPGKFIQSLKRAEASNPVFLLDEIDKMSTDFRGDPSAALLEVLDPEQNATFNDHYLDLDYDLSRVMFICTANDLSNIPTPLRDRMEIIELGGYTDQEKLQIARRYLVAKQQANSGVGEVDITISDQALERVICDYTREAGVRNLEREIGAIFRKIARRAVAEGTELCLHVDATDLQDYLGAPRHLHKGIDAEDQVGLTNGMAWTQFGGVMLQAEATIMPGSGQLVTTGKLGDVMQESARAAITYVRTRAAGLGLSPDFHEQVDIHVHFPQAALPKDGPSAGVTMITSVVSALTGIPVRRDVAMTGEITLRGRVLAVGGVKEKLLAAHRAGVTRALIPADNEPDLLDVPASVRRSIDVVLVREIDELLGHALCLQEPQAFRRNLQACALPFYLDDAHRARPIHATHTEADDTFEPDTPVTRPMHLDDSPIH